MSQSGDSAAAAAQKAAMEAMFRLFEAWDIKNEDTAKYYAAAMVGFIALFTAFHWSHLLIDKYAGATSILASIGRSTRDSIRRFNNVIEIGPVTVRPGLVILALTYFGIIAALAFYDQPYDVMTTMQAKRFGWLALCNICFTVFLGLKNTPLSPLAGRSFDSLNVIHRCVGYTSVVLVILHGITYTVGLSDSGYLSILTEGHQVAGAVAGVSMVLIFVTANGFIRRRQYEVFYATHLLLTTMVLVAVALHRYDMTHVLAAILVAIGCIAADQALRMARWVYYGQGNYCTITPLSEDATKVTLHRPIRAQPGSSAFLWIPGIRLCQRHPFTLFSASPQAEFIIKARDGFTSALYAAAYKTPGMKLRASIEGPYGNVPNAHNYDKVILLSGGSGVTFSMCVAMDWNRKQRTPNDNSTLQFIWAVRNRANLDWCEAELAELEKNPRVTLNLYVTSSGTSETKASIGAPDPERDVEHADRKELQTSESRRSSNSASRAAETGRPDMRALIEQAVATMPREQKVLVAGCGPASLRNDIRRAVIECTRKEAPSIELYLEEFSY